MGTQKDQRLPGLLGIIRGRFLKFIDRESNVGCVVDLEDLFRQHNIEEMAKQYTGAIVVVPLGQSDETKQKIGEMGLTIQEISGMNLPDSCQLVSGIIVPQNVAEDSGLKYRQYPPRY